MERNEGFIGAVLAMVLLATPAAATLFDILSGPDSPRAESIARTPSLDTGWGRYVADSRFYIKQRFATKDQLIALNGFLKTEIFASSPYPKVVQGEDDFLFLADDEAINYFQHTELSSTGSLSAWRAGLIATSTRIAAEGARYQVLIAPNKDSLYSDQLPDWFNQHQHQQSRLDQLFAVLQDSPVGITYPLAALQKAVVDFPHASPFFKTDTHWNEFGAGIGALQLLEDLGIPFEASIYPQPYTPEKAGDLARMIGQQDLMVEDGWTLPDEWLIARCVLPNGEIFLNQQTDPFKFDRVDCTGGQSNGLKALIFMDSFGVGLVPSLSAAFEEAVFVWSYKVDEALLEQIRPNFVIHQLVERKLQTLKATDLFLDP